MTERDYQRGRTALAQSILQRIDFDLGATGRSARSLRNERASAVAALREVCAEHGDNDWPDDLNLADVIEKHLGRHLGERR